MPCSGKMGIGGTVDLEVVVVLGVVRAKEVVESDVPLALSVFGELVVIPEEDVPWEGVSVTVGPGEEDEWFFVVGFVRMLV